MCLGGLGNEERKEREGKRGGNGKGRQLGDAINGTSMNNRARPHSEQQSAGFGKSGQMLTPTVGGIFRSKFMVKCSPAEALSAKG